MQLKLISVEHNDGRPEAVVEMRIGTGRLRLATTPELKRSAVHHFELTIDEVLVLGKNAHRTDSRMFSFAEDGDALVLTGWVDSVDADGLIYFRLGVDSLTMIEAEPDQFAVGEWLELVLARGSVVAYLSYQRNSV